MTDVVEIARLRRARLAAEVARLDAFIRMAEALLRHWQERGGDEGRDDGGDGDGTGPVPPTAGLESAAAPAAKPATDSAAPIPERKQATAIGSAGASALAAPQTAAEPAAAAPDTESVSGAEDEHFQFSEPAAAEGDELVLSEPAALGDARVNAHVGMKLRQRRWMMGMTKKQLADKLGIDVEEMQRYERGEVHIGSSRMWHLAAALEVPMSYFFDDMEAQAAAVGEEPETEERGRALLVKTA